ncbi:MAG TPA: HD domain-containing protein [bacterium]|jgi:3'-5' exoribonuclease|nr:HD domain-containing protein [bacterium]
MGKEHTKDRYISSLKVGERIKDYFVATGATLTPFRPESGKRGSFLRLTLSDRTGSLPAIMWEGGERAFSQLGTEGTGVQIKGNVGQYRGDLQLVVEEITIADESSLQPAWFLPSSPRPLPTMEKELRAVINEVKSAPLSRLLEIIFDDEDFYRAFVQAPAAKMIHHAYLSGLLEHTLETVGFAVAIANQYPHYINRDLLLTGALLHDSGKIFEYSWEGLSFTITDEGRLFGHIVLTARLVEKTIASIKGFPTALRHELIHMILAHHGIEEWGSPRPPKTINAFALHHADYLSCELDHFQGLLQRGGGSKDNWTTMDRKLGRSVFSGFLAPDEIATGRQGVDIIGEELGSNKA